MGLLKSNNMWCQGISRTRKSHKICNVKGRSELYTFKGWTGVGSVGSILELVKKNLNTIKRY
jgi:hypothetical protein